MQHGRSVLAGPGRDDLLGGGEDNHVDLDDHRSGNDACSWKGGGSFFGFNMGAVYHTCHSDGLNVKTLTHTGRPDFYQKNAKHSKCETEQILHGEAT